MDDRTFKLIVAAGAGALAVTLVFLRFCGDLAVPAKPAAPPPKPTAGAATDILAASSATPDAWAAFLAKDAATAGVATPSAADMGRVLPHQVADKTITLAPGAAPIDVAGVRLSVEHTGADGDDEDLILVIENPGTVDLAYQILTRPSVGLQTCRNRNILFYDANVVGAGRRERRSECVWRDDEVLNIDRVETVELAPLSAWYVSRVPPSMLTVDTRLVVGHKPVSGAVPCNVMMSQAIRSGVESGQIEWRDLVDFYARHRCDTYQFPVGYKAFRQDGERQLPVVRIPH